VSFLVRPELPAAREENRYVLTSSSGPKLCVCCWVAAVALHSRECDACQGHCSSIPSEEPPEWVRAASRVRRLLSANSEGGPGIAAGWLIMVAETLLIKVKLEGTRGTLGGKGPSLGVSMT
jgi:hypothetical protein